MLTFVFQIALRPFPNSFGKGLVPTCRPYAKGREPDSVMQEEVPSGTNLMLSESCFSTHQHNPAHRPSLPLDLLLILSERHAFSFRRMQLVPTSTGWSVPAELPGKDPVSPAFTAAHLCCASTNLLALVLVDPAAAQCAKTKS